MGCLRPQRKDGAEEDKTYGHSLHKEWLRRWSEALAFMRHDVEDEAVGLVHSAAADGGEVVYAAVHVVLDDALGRGDITVLDGEHG